jgi:hypothetical protein
MVKNMISDKWSCFIALYTVILFLITGCSKPAEQPQKMLDQNKSNSQEMIPDEDYAKAYQNYIQKISLDPSSANAGKLANILYSWAISQSNSKDVPLLNAQKQVILNPQPNSLRSKLLAVAIDRNNKVLYVFGIGVPPEDETDSVKRRFLAHESALADSVLWLGRLLSWESNGVKEPMDISRKIIGVVAVKEDWIMDTVYVIKAQAPLNQKTYK